jgi:heme/copper-type cytochrome/quinol oxidase subunit 4
MAKASVRAGALRSSMMVWAALVIFTLASFILGGEHVVGDKTVAAAVVVGIAAVKIRLVGIHFMELRHAPPALRTVFEVYCVLLFIVITGIYLMV